MKNKNAFSLAELLVAFVIIGVISTYAVRFMQTYDKGIRFVYSNTYHTLDRALYNAFHYSDKKNPFDEKEYDEKSGQEVEVSPEEGANRLCEWLGEYLNGSQSCSSSDLAEDTGKNFGSIKFRTDNGIEYYITKRLPDENNPNKREGDPPFFIIYADFHNIFKDGSGSMFYQAPTEQNGYTRVDPTIFAFAALNNGRICPLGPPEVDPRFMQTRIAYISLIAENDDPSVAEAAVTRYSTISKPYFVSKAEAWGYYLDNDPDEDRKWIDEEPASYNGYIRDMLPEDNEIYRFLGEEKTIPIPEDMQVSLQSGAISGGGYGCAKLSADECWVIIDKYLY